jgi:imidazolonepropionase-like amidohydrolase
MSCMIIVGATLHTPTGPVQGTLVVVDQRIEGVGATVAGLTGTSFRGQACTSVDGAGKQVTSGLFAAPTQLGLVEIGLEPDSRDDDPELEGDPIRASLVAADALDPRSRVLAVQRIEGVTHALSIPTGGFVSGMGATIRLRGETQAEMIVDRDAIMAVSLPSGSFADGLRQLRELVADVRNHAARPTAYDSGRPYFPGASRLDLEALRPVALGEIPLLVGANRASEIEALLRVGKELGLQLVISGAAEGWLVAEQLAQAKVPVIVDPLTYGPSSFDELYARPDNAALLAKAGVPLILTTESTHNARTLRQVAGNAVREGLPHADALRAITETPSRVLGSPDRGRLAVGAPADLVLWTGDPLELSSRAERVWIDGSEVDLRSRQTELRDRYRTLPGTPSPALAPQ